MLQYGIITKGLFQIAGNPVSMFAPHGQGQLLARLMVEIEQNLSSFERPPLGPFGTLLSLADDHWATAVEASIGKVFNSFIVHNGRDAALLRVSCCPCFAKILCLEMNRVPLSS